MKSFAIVILAATALVPAAAAEAGGSAPRPSAGVSWHGGGMHGGGMHRGGMHGGMKGSHHGGMKGGHHGGMKGGHHGGWKGGWNGGHHGGWKGGHHNKWGGHKGFKHHNNYRRFDRGFFLPSFWWGQQFSVNDWQDYGFYAPPAGCRWIRYYDDALLVDQYGRVRDGRWGMNWDRYEDDWDIDDQGIPYYRGDGGDYDEEDYAEGPGMGPDGPPPPPPPPPPAPCANPCAAPGYAYPNGYWGWMPGGMITITETTVHPAREVVTETVYIEKKAKRRSYKRPRPRPTPGERG